VAKRRGKLETVRLNTPVAPDAIAGLKLGQVVYLSGVVYTAREGVYRRILDDGVAPPVDFGAQPLGRPDLAALDVDQRSRTGLVYPHQISPAPACDGSEMRAT
jgi:hypothetical protein